MAHGRSRLVPITDVSQVGETRRLAVGVGEAVGLDETERGQVAIIATELGTNILKHAGHGAVIIRELQYGIAGGVELLSLDKGPGMADIHRCLEDGYSTAGSSGTGLGSISRLSTRFDAYSASGQGAVILSQVWSKRETKGELARYEIGAVCLPMHQGEGCGDGWSVRMESDHLEFIAVDGLGHGEFAAMAADEAIRIFEGSSEANLEMRMQDLHGALKKTRGAAVALGEIKSGGPKLRFVGVGNISGAVFGYLRSQSMVSCNGTVGHVVNRLKQFEYPWSRDSILVLHSDGLSSKWDLKDYPGLQMRHPAVIAGVLYRDHHRSTDDANVLVIREAASHLK